MIMQLQVFQSFSMGRQSVQIGEATLDLTPLPKGINDIWVDITAENQHTGQIRILLLFLQRK